ncbi:MAG: hypothetical protein ACRDV3_13880 [Acidothermaceae bacterium]
MADDQAGQEPEDQADPFDNWVLDDDFVRGGSYEPPARTRVAIARFGGRQTSWRHGGGLHDQSRERRSADLQRSPLPRRPPKRPGAPRKIVSSSAESKLPIIVTIVVVVIAAYLLFR